MKTCLIRLQQLREPAKPAAGRVLLRAVRARLLSILAFLFLSALVPGGSLLSMASTLDNEPLVANARLAEANRDYSGALGHYQQFLRDNPDSKFASQIMTRVSVLQDATRNGTDASLSLIHI